MGDPFLRLTEHRKLKRLLNTVRGFNSMKTAYTSKGFELVYMSKKGRVNAWKCGQGHRRRTLFC
jgi:transposase, IS6 family